MSTLLSSWLVRQVIARSSRAGSLGISYFYTTEVTGSICRKVEEGNQQQENRTFFNGDQGRGNLQVNLNGSSGPHVDDAKTDNVIISEVQRDFRHQYLNQSPQPPIIADQQSKSRQSTPQKSQTSLPGWRSKNTIQSKQTWDELGMYMETVGIQELKPWEAEAIWRQLVFLYVSKENGMVSSDSPTVAGKAGKDFMHILEKVTNQKINQQMGANYAAKIMHSCGKLRYKSEDMLQGLQKVILYDLDNAILLPRYLSTALWDASLVDYYPDGLCGAFDVFSDDFIAQFNLQNICNSLFALAYFKHYPTEDLLDKLMARIKYYVCVKQESSVVPQNLSDLMFALTRFQYTPDEELIQYIITYATNNVNKFSTKQAYDLLLGLTVINRYDVKLLGLFEDELDFAAQTSGISDKESLLGMYLVFLSYFQHYGDELPDSFFQHPITMQSRNLWVTAASNWHHTLQKDPSVQTIMLILDQLQVNYQVGYFDEEFEVCMDVYIGGDGGGSRCGLLIQEESEVFVNDADRRSGESVLIQKLIEQAGYETAVINVRDWNLLGNDALRKMFLTQVLVSKGINVPQQQILS